MITIETTSVALLEITKSKEKSGEAFVKIISDFIKDEPNYCSFLLLALSKVEQLSNPVTASIFSIALYEKLKAKQKESDDMKKDFQ